MDSSTNATSSGGALPASLMSRHGSLVFPDTTVLFRTMLNTVAEKLTPENVDSLMFIHDVSKAEGDGRERLSALDVLRKLVNRGVFSADHLEPLEEMLDNINRNDIKNTIVKGFKLKMKGSVRRSDSDPSLSMRRTGSWAGSMPDPLQSLRPEGLTRDEKKGLLSSLARDPELEGEVQSLVKGQSSQASPASSLGCGSLTPEKGTITHQQSRDSRGSVSSGFISSPETSLSQGPGLPRPDGSLCVVPESEPVTHNHHSTSQPPLATQTSEEDFLNVGTSIAATTMPHPPAIPITKKRMEWSICRVELGQRIVKHSNKAFFKGNFSLSASGIRRRPRNPVSLVFKVYPFGVGKDENQSLTLETVVACRSDDLRAVAKVNLEVTLSMDSHRKFLSTRTWQKPLRTFQVHDFLPHEVVTHNNSRTLDLTIEAYITFD